MAGIFVRKSIEQSKDDGSSTDENSLRKNLSVFDLTVFGIGVVIGTGIFVLTGQQAHRNAGPAIGLSFVLAAVACTFAALCYAEFAASVPVAGSAYTFGYATLGEIVAWIIGWDLVLELALGAAVDAKGWSGYLQELFSLPNWMAGDKTHVDFAAVVLVLVLSALLIVGTKLSGRVTAVLVVVKIAVVLFVIVLGLFYVKSANYHPFLPHSQPAAKGSGGGEPLLQAVLGIAPGHFGLWGVVAAASLVFFAYIGFDIVATSAEETKNPQRDVPRGIISSLVICTILYIAVSTVIVGMLKYSDPQLDSSAPLANTFKVIGVDWAARIVSLGGLLGLTTVVLVLMMGQARILFAMSRDGLLPKPLSNVTPRFGTPWLTTAITGVVVAVLAAFLPLSKLSELVNIGTLFAFVVVSIGVVVLRHTRPDIDRPFKVPGVPWLPALSVIACAWLMVNLPVDTWIRFAIWLALGMVIYFAYGYRNSRVRQEAESSSSTAV